MSDARPTHRTVGFTCSPRLRSALVARVRREQSSINKVIRDILERELLAPRETEPTGPVGERLATPDGRGLGRFLKVAS